MTKFKIILWTAVIFVIQTVIVSHIHILGAVPSVVMSYMICVVIMENEFRDAVIISAVCAFVMGALSGRNMVVVTLLYAYSAIMVFSLRKKPVYIGNLFKAVMWTFIVSAVTETVYYAACEWSVNLDVLLYDALPTAVLNLIGTLVVYPILKKTMYKEEKKKLLIA